MAKKPAGTDYTLHPGRLLSLQWQEETDGCYLWLFSERQAQMLRRMLAVIPKYYWVWNMPSPQREWSVDDWNLWDAIQNDVSELEVCLTMGCELSLLLEKLDNITASIDTVGVNIASGDCPDVNLTAYAIQGASLAQADGVENGTPPDGSSTPDPTINNRKCKAAQFVTDGLMSMVLQLDTYDVPSWYELAQLDGFLRQMLGTSHLSGWYDNLYGFYQWLAALVFGEALPYNTIYTDMQANYESLICALFEAQTATDARSDFMTVLGYTGASERFLEGLLQSDILNLLFFANADSEAEIDAWPVTYDCTSCGGQTEYLSAFHQCVAHQTVDGGTTYNPTVENTSNALGIPDGVNAHFNGSYYVDVVYRTPYVLTQPVTVTMVATLTKANWHRILVNPSPTANWNSAGWQQLSMGLTGTATVNVGSVRLQALGDAGFNADILLDGCTLSN